MNESYYKALHCIKQEPRQAIFILILSFYHLHFLSFILEALGARHMQF